MLWRTSNYGVTSFHAELFPFFFEQHGLPLFIRMVREVLTKENINDCLRPPLAIASAIVGRWSLPDRNLLKPTIQHLIALGADPHQGLEDESTLLENLMWRIDHPWDSASVGREWLDILMGSRIDVVEYLRTEHRLHFDPSRSLPMLRSERYHDYRARYLIISEEPPSLSWDWFIDAEGNAFEVLEEFKNFGPGRHALYNDYYQPSSMPNWPFFYHRWHWLAERKAHGLLYKVQIAHAQLAHAQLAEERFERRWHKKGAKLARAQGLARRGLKIPGAWID
jgi:hypothetical protein